MGIGVKLSSAVVLVLMLDAAKQVAINRLDEGRYQW
jgi:hypothetical protein